MVVGIPYTPVSLGCGAARGNGLRRICPLVIYVESDLYGAEATAAVHASSDVGRVMKIGWGGGLWFVVCGLWGLNRSDSLVR